MYNHRVMFQIKKMNNIKLFFRTVFLSIFFTQPAFAQSDSLLNLINDLSEDETYLNDLLLELAENPININDADHEDLLAIPLLSHEIADSIILLRKREGRFQSKRQLRKIITPAIYNLIKEFIITSEKQTYKLKVTQRNSFKVENVPEIESGKYQGSAVNNYSRIKYQYNPYYSFGFIAQKDPGELNYIDHLNFSAQYLKDNWNIIAGDFYLQFGQGLSHSNPYGNKKSIYLSSVFREPSKIARTNLTSSESTGKRGVFARNTIGKKLDIFAFYSKAERDVKIEDKSIIGFKYDGYHRSSSEIDSKNKISEKNWGTGVHYAFNSSLKIGGLFNQYTFDKPIENNFVTSGDTTRSQYFDYEGNRLNQMALNYIYKIKNVKFSGEYSQANKGGPGWSQSVYYSQDKFNMGFNYWRLAKDFYSVDGRAFDDGDVFPQGVTGYFAGLQFKLSNSIALAAFKLYEQKLWHGYFDPMPTEKNEWLSQLDWQTGNVSTTLRFRSKDSESFELVQDVDTRVRQNQKFIRLEVKFNPSKNVRLKTRWEHTFIENSHEKGTLIYQDFEYFLFENINFNTRFSFFNTTSFKSRIYEYERDLPGSFSNRALFDNGMKSYLLIKWKVYDNFHLWLKGRYSVKYNTLENGDVQKELNRDIRLQFTVSF